MSAAPYPATTISGGCAVAFDWRHIEDRADWLLLPSTARPWLLMLWFRAWSQQPCGSIPSDHIEICRLIGMPLGAFMPLRDRLLRGGERRRADIRAVQCAGVVSGVSAHPPGSAKP